MLTKGETSLNTIELYKSLQEDITEYNLKDYGFMFTLIAFTDGEIDTNIFDKTLFNLKLYQMHMRRDYFGEVIGLEQKVYDLIPCAYQIDGLFNQRMRTIVRQNGFYCPDTKDFLVQGNIISGEFKAFTLSVQKWKGHAYWKTDAEINAALEKMDLVMGITNYFFDSHSYDNPIQVNFEPIGDFSLINGLNQNHKISVQINEAATYDSFIYDISPKKHKYVTIKEKGNIWRDI
jgi:hypothetical protein